jgi:hypothetical protein
MLVTLSVYTGLSVNCAVTVLVASMVAVQLVGVPATGVQPVQLVNVELASGVACRTTVVALVVTA